jgi:competence protein ComEC
MSPLARPSPQSSRLLAAAALVWLGVWVGRRPEWIPALVVVIGLALAVTSRRWGEAALAGMAAVAVGLGSGLLSHRAEAAVLEARPPTGPQIIRARILSDPVPGRYGGETVLLRPVARMVSGGWQSWRGHPLLARLEAGSGVEPAWMVDISGTLLSRPGIAAGRPYAGIVRVDEVLMATRPSSPLWAIGNAIRRRILQQVDPARDPPSALLAGFLVGYTSDLPEVDLLNLRRSGLAHFVAVSGSNVALFLGVWWIVLGPLGMGRRRVWFGLAALLVFAIVTRWEPSVVRAAAMAAVVLLGRRMGVPVDGWSALAITVAGVLLLNGAMADNAGFQLSVAATAGVMAGSRLTFGLRRPLGEALGATVGAQGAVLPLMLSLFGQVPVGAPVANLLAAPVVAVSTIAGGLGAISGVAPILGLARTAAGLVLSISRVVGRWPQLDPGQAAVTVGALGVAYRFRRHPLAFAVVCGGLAWAVLLPHGQVAGPAAVVLDVGQGDSILLIGSHQETVLVDGGPEAASVLDALARYHVKRIDLMVLTHVHEDHAAGLIGVVRALPVSAFWSATDGHTSPSWQDLELELKRAAVPMDTPAVGTVVHLGGMTIEVLGPQRRYAGPNDQSIVLMVESGDVSMLLTGDIERFAQADLGPLQVDVLKVPHQGGNTSDPSWLQASVRKLAVISVGQNNFGHPSPEVLATLDDVVPVLRTDLSGDVVIPLQTDALNRLVAAASG